MCACSCQESAVKDSDNLFTPNGKGPATLVDSRFRLLTAARGVYKRGETPVRRAENVACRYVSNAQRMRIWCYFRRVNGVAER